MKSKNGSTQHKPLAKPERARSSSSSTVADKLFRLAKTRMTMRQGPLSGKTCLRYSCTASRSCFAAFEPPGVPAVSKSRWNYISEQASEYVNGRLTDHVTVCINKHNDIRLRRILGVNAASSSLQKIAIALQRTVLRQKFLVSLATLLGLLRNFVRACLRRCQRESFTSGGVSVTVIALIMPLALTLSSRKRAVAVLLAIISARYFL